MATCHLTYKIQRGLITNIAMITEEDVHVDLQADGLEIGLCSPPLLRRFRGDDGGIGQAGRGDGGWLGRWRLLVGGDDGTWFWRRRRLVGGWGQRRPLDWIGGEGVPGLRDGDEGIIGIGSGRDAGYRSPSGDDDRWDRKSGDDEWRLTGISATGIDVKSRDDDRCHQRRRDGLWGGGVIQGGVTE